MRRFATGGVRFALNNHHLNRVSNYRGGRRL